MNLATALECTYRLAASSGVPHFTRQVYRQGRGWRWVFSMERPAGDEVFQVDAEGQAICLHLVAGIECPDEVVWQPSRK